MFFFMNFFQSWIKDRSVSTNGPGPFSKFSKNIKKKIEKLFINNLKAFIENFFTLIQNFVRKFRINKKI